LRYLKKEFQSLPGQAIFIKQMGIRATLDKDKKRVWQQGCATSLLDLASTDIWLEVLKFTDPLPDPTDYMKIVVEGNVVRKDDGVLLASLLIQGGLAEADELVVSWLFFIFFLFYSFLSYQVNNAILGPPPGIATSTADLKRTARVLPHGKKERGPGEGGSSVSTTTSAIKSDTSSIATSITSTMSSTTGTTGSTSFLPPSGGYMVANRALDNDVLRGEIERANRQAPPAVVSARSSNSGFSDVNSIQRQHREQPMSPPPLGQPLINPQMNYPLLPLVPPPRAQPLLNPQMNYPVPLFVSPPEAQPFFNPQMNYPVPPFVPPPEAQPPLNPMVQNFNFYFSS
jgi:hypothetical protein